MTGTMTDVSHMIWAGPMQKNRFKEATQLKGLISTSIDAVDTIQASATHKKRIVDDILMLSKLDSKLLVINPIVIQPSALLQDAYKIFKDEANKARVDLEAILDPSRVLQVLINLLTNAIKFTQSQEVRKVDVIMSVSRKADQMPGVEYVPQEAVRKDFLTQAEWYNTGEPFYLHFTVRDTGCGLSPEHKAKLFLRFLQATPKTHVQYGGSGLGLFISREPTEMQGGSIGVSSVHNVGSTFTFYIKSRRAKDPNTLSTTNGNNKNGSLPNRSKAQIIQGDIKAPDGALPSAVPMEDQENGRVIDDHKYYILVVEDNLINQRVLSTQLKKLGHTIHVANHGFEALSQLSRTSFSPTPSVTPPLPLSVVHMDVEMPIMDGLTCTRRIREIETNGELSGHVPIIAVSANARREQIDMAKEAGVDEAICKPFRIPELVALIRGLGIRGE
ncbi:histidine kinase-like ATPase [Alternaria rosae]|uniref:histidine kinase-like ATPase n=1 Tax=Alternaria rosae TaxID=1187941 RepID=UPI001E8D0ED4|nr:histidine kinase-like ATPase [Alternaria rosae]KAH6875978.1 histidine kinase-like ATPase [Alternaria rosae]